MIGVCAANDVGRVAWIESLGSEPAGDCAGPLYDVLGADASLCERHLLQYNLDGRKYLATLNTSVDAALSSSDRRSAKKPLGGMADA